MASYTSVDQACLGLVVDHAWPNATVSPMPGLMERYRPCLALCNGIARAWPSVNGIAHAWPYTTVSPMPGQLKASCRPCLGLTDAGGGEEPDALVRRLALREEELDGVLGEGERHNRHGAGADDEALRPQPYVLTTHAAAYISERRGIIL